MGHHHGHHGGHHHGLFKNNRNGLGRPGGGQIQASWGLVLAMAAVLFAYGAFETLVTYRIYMHGEQGMGVVTHVQDRTTTLQVNGHVCAVSGEAGHVGRMVPVAYPPNRQGNCIVRRPSAFGWGAGAMLMGAALAIGIFFWRRGIQTTTATPGTA